MLKKYWFLKLFWRVKAGLSTPTGRTGGRGMANPPPWSLVWRFWEVWRVWCWFEASTRLEARGLGGLGGTIHGGTSPTKVSPPIREEAVPAGLEGVVTAGEEEAVHM